MIVQEKRTSEEKANSFNQDIDDNLHFKPISEGLGFHRNERENKVSSTSFLYPEERRKMDERKRKSFYREKAEHTNRILPAMVKEKKKSVKKDKEVFRKAPLYYSQFTAYLIDLAVIFLLVLGVGILFSFSTVGKLDYRFFLERKTLDEIILCSLLYILYYLAYFSFMEPDKTVGKGLLKINTLHISGRKASIYQCFVRAVVTLFSTCAFFFPLLLRLQDKLSETKLQQK